jgi:hypothetical protein
MNITLLAKEPEVGTPPFEFPKHSFRAFWTDDGRIGVVAVVYRQDGGVHLMQDTIDPPKDKK